MEKDYWLNRWETGNIRFNQDTPHRFLVKYFNKLGLHSGEQIFVPLCGKSIDMIWLMKQNQIVIGVEISSIAIRDFLKENNLNTTQQTEPGFDIFQNKSCLLYNGDLFNFPSEHLLQIKAIYDRGCLTAFPPKGLRSQYVDWLKIHTPIRTQILLVVLEHSAVEMKEPPFSNSEEEVGELFKSHFDITPLAREYISDIPPHWMAKGVCNLYECAYLLKKSS